MQGIRANQWVISNENLSPEQLDQAVQETLRNLAYSTFDLFNSLNDPASMRERTVYSPEVKNLLQLLIDGKLCAVVVGIHLSNFDFVSLATNRRGLNAMALSMPEANEAIERQHVLRRKYGMDIVPATRANLRKALEQLRAGKTVMTGIDRPWPESKYRPRFFGRPAAVPVMHIYLALKTKVPVYVVAAIKKPDGKYHIFASDAIHMKPHPDRHTEIIHNAETVLETAAGFIRQAPRQWGMFHPVWPDVWDEVP